MFVEKHYIEETDVPVDVYNFQVEDHHTYFVGESAVWVHNNNKACPVPEPRKSEKHKTADGEPLTYKSNSKHTPGQDGNCSDAGIEPRNSFELFEDSIASKKLVIDMHMKKKQIRFTDFSQMQRKQNGTGVVQKIKEKIL